MFRHNRGYSFIWWGVFFALVLGPLLTMGIELGRYARAAGEAQKAVDLAALAAAREVDVIAFRDEGIIQFLPSAYAVATSYAGANSDFLSRYGIGVNIESISLDPETLEVRLVGTANVSALFPAWLPEIVIRKEGRAQARFR